MIRLYLLGEKGLNVLKGLDNQYFHYISEVIIGRDKGVIKDYSDEIQAFCEEHNLIFYSNNQLSQISEFKYSITIGWRWLIYSDKPLIVIHDSILPRLRGFNPLVTALINGDTEIGATALFAEEGYDEGPIITQMTTKINYPIRIAEAIKIVSSLYVDIINFLFDSIINQKLTSQIQDHSLATYSLWRDENDYQINWNWSAEKIKRFIDAVSHPYKGAFSLLHNQKVRILEGKISPDIIIENRSPGKVLFKKEDSYTIVCGSGLIEISEFFNDDLSLKIYFNNFRIKFI